MKLRYLRNFGLGLLSFLMISSQAYASADREVRINELEHQMKQVGTETAIGTYGANTATARPEVDGRGWFISFDLLYWKARVAGTEYAYTDQDKIASLPIKGRKKSMEFGWDWGIRAGIGYNFDNDGWDFNARYTWWETAGSDSVRAGLNSSVVPLRGSSSLTTAAAANQTVGEFIFATSAKSLYNIDYQAVDVELGRDYYVSSTLSLRPFWGLKTAWIDQEQKTHYTGGDPTVNQGIHLLGLQGNTVHVKEDCDFWGLGPRTGINSRWYMGNKLSIFGNVSGALLLGHFDVDHKERYSAVGDARIRLHANRHAFAPMVNFELGMRYDTYLNNDRNHLGIGVGFEAEYWWRQNQMLKIDDFIDLKYERYSEDIAFYGLTADIRWDF